MAANFPATAPSFTDYVGTEKLGTSSGGLLHSGKHNREEQEITALAAKLGLSAASPVDTPAANLVLISDATGKSKWATITSAMITDGTIAAADMGLAWSTFTVTNVLQGNNLSGFSTQYARYMTIGKRTRVSLRVTVTNATGATGGYGVGVEIPLATLGTPAHVSTTGYVQVKGNMGVLDSATGLYMGSAAFYSTSIVQATAHGGTDWMGINTPAFTLAVNDSIGLDIEYEIT